MNNESWTSSELLANVQAGDERAAEAIFERYVQRLTLLARTRLSGRLAARTDPEDVVMSAWRSFFIGARAGRFSLERSGDLWRLLVSITLHKLYRQARRHSTESRSTKLEQSVDWTDDRWQPIDGREPSPDEAIALADELQAILEQVLPGDRLVLQMRLQGESLEAIAAKIGDSERTIRRKLAKLRDQLEQTLLRERDQE